MSTLLVPELTSGRGTGHLRRVIRLMRRLADARLLVRDAPAEFAPLLASVPEELMCTRPDGATLIVCDRFAISADECRNYRTVAPVIGVDTGGDGRAECDYLIDTLPRLDGSTANLVVPGADAHSITSGLHPSSSGRFLVTFGGEDSSGLTELTVRALGEYRDHLKAITVIRPALRTVSLPDYVEVVEPQDGIADLLASHQFVLTSFGLTAFEARATGCAVLLVNPTGYHERLSRAAGFRSAGVRRLARRTVRRFVVGAGGDREGAPAEKADGAESPTLTALIESVRVPALMYCPACGGDGTVVYRNPEKTYRRCNACGLVYLQRFVADEESYGEEYFMEEYASQYGRTYLEDFDHIKRMGSRRVEVIESLGVGGRRLLDVGCAYGPFLAAASERGFDVAGADIADAPTAYVRDSLGLPAVTGDIRDASVRSSLPHRRFDVVALWYVIEHFAALDAMLTTLSDIVEPGGLLALATPHGGGISARRRSETFYRSSPRDHFTIWDRRSAPAVLERYGFTIERFVITGHHPERYPMVAKGLLPVGVARLHSRIAGWGDTFEIYARRSG